MLTGVALTFVYGATVIAHGVWWRHLRGRVPARLRRRRIQALTKTRRLPWGDVAWVILLWGVIIAFAGIVLYEVVRWLIDGIW
jgi:hypothetical protein